MFNLIKASLFKLFRDRTFQVTAIIGAVLAALIILINLGIGSLKGESLFLSVANPGSNFGLTIPINLIVFTVGEFTYGTVRNKIIAGLSKAKIYCGLFITGLVFTFILMGAYVAIIVGISSAVGGFNADIIGGAKFVGCYIAYVTCEYIFITAVSVFFATLIRQIGGANSIVIILLVFLSLLPLIVFGANATIGGEMRTDHWSMWLNPLYMSGFYGNNVFAMFAGLLDVFNQTPQMIAAGIVCPLAWSAIFGISGLLIFKHSDVK